jgi:hypothetical protein
MAGRRGWGEDSIYFDHSGECRDSQTHWHCPGRWRGVVSLKSGPDGKLRHTFVSLLSENGMAIEEISRLVGHSSTLVTQTVYRHELRPMVTSGAEKHAHCVSLSEVGAHALEGRILRCCVRAARARPEEQHEAAARPRAAGPP